MPEGGQRHPAYSRCPDLKSEPAAVEVKVDMSAFLMSQCVPPSELDSSVGAHRFWSDAEVGPDNGRQHREDNYEVHTGSQGLWYAIRSSCLKIAELVAPFPHLDGTGEHLQRITGQLWDTLELPL